MGGVAGDAMDKSNHENHLLPTLDLLRQVMDRTKDIIFIIGDDRFIRYTNRGDKPSSGKSSGSGWFFNELTCKDIYLALREPIETVFQSGKSLSIERHLGKGSQGVWIHTQLTPHIGVSGKTSSVLVIVRDISSLKLKEKLITESKAEWLQAIDTMPHLLAVIDTDYRIKKTNMALANYLGISLEDLHGRICHQTFGTGIHESCPLNRSSSSGCGSKRFQSNILGQPFLITASALADAEGNTTGCLFVALGLNGHRSGEEIRKTNAEQMKLLLKEADYVVTILDQNGKYISMKALPGNIRLPDSIIGKSPFDFFEPEVASKICDHITKAMRAGGDITVSNELKLDGETFHLLEHLSPVRDESGNVSSVMIIGKRIAWVPEKSDPVPNESLQLSPRELEILQLIGSGLTTSQIAEKLFISRKTVESHRARVMRRLGIHKSSALVQYAVKSGLF